MLHSIRMAHTLLEQRIVREELMAPLSSLAEPCWLILLQLFCADDAEKRSAVGVAQLLDVGIGTAERYLKLLEKQGFVKISHSDANMTAVLQPTALRAMEVILAEMRQQSRVALD